MTAGQRAVWQISCRSARPRPPSSPTSVHAKGGSFRAGAKNGRELGGRWGGRSPDGFSPALALSVGAATRPAADCRGLLRCGRLSFSIYTTMTPPRCIWGGREHTTPAGIRHSGMQKITNEQQFLCKYEKRRRPIRQILH